MWFCHLGKNIDYVVFLVPKYQHVLNSSNNCSCRLEQLYAHFSNPSISMCKLFLCANKVWFFFFTRNWGSWASAGIQNLAYASSTT